MSKNIEININTGSVYEMLYPKSVSELILNSNTLSTLLGVTAESSIDDSFNNIKTLIDNINSSISNIDISLSTKGKIEYGNLLGSKTSPDLVLNFSFSPCMIIAYERVISTFNNVISGHGAIGIKGSSYYILFSGDNSDGGATFQEKIYFNETKVIIQNYRVVLSNLADFYIAYFGIG